MRNPSSRADLDDVDRRLIKLLQDNGRTSNRALASDIGMTEATVSARIRNLFEHRVLGVTATLDWVAAGYMWDAWLEVRVEGRPILETGTELGAVDGVHAVYAVFGPMDLLVHVLLPSASGASDFIDQVIAAVPGVREVHANVTLQTLKYETRYVARLPVPAGELRFPAPVVPLDDLDRALVEAVVLDGRSSNRAIAQELRISEGTVRTRLRRLEDAGLMKIVGQCDPVRAGIAATWAFVSLEIEPGHLKEVAARLCTLEESVIVAATAGTRSLLTLLATPSRTRLAGLVIEELRALPGVRASLTWQVIRALSDDYRRWARLL